MTRIPRYTPICGAHRREGIRFFRMAAAAIFLAGAVASAQERATGVVYHDANENAVRDPGEEGIPGVGVSNGRDVVLTDDEGRYRLPVSNDTILFTIKPTNWQTRLDENNLPRFYYIHKPEGSPPGGKFPGVEATGPLPESVDFPLYQDDEPTTFDMIVFGDPQPRNVEEVHYIAHDIVEELVGSEAAFGVTLGDIVFDDLDVFEPLNGVIGTIGVPWYNVIGNHDLNMDTEDDTLSDETFERLYGPSYYSYNYGGVHFVVLDNVVWEGDGYHGEFGKEQLEFVKNDLDHVDDEALVVYLMHIPLVDVDDKADFFAIIDERPRTFSISAHWHRQRHYAMGKEDGWQKEGSHHHLVHGTVSGSWWTGLKDEFDIPHTMMRDGTPNGYSIATFRNNRYAFRYKAARRPAEFQMSVYAPSVVETGGLEDAEIIANVFMGSNESEVHMRIGEDGDWIPMTHDVRPDPYYEKLKAREYYLPPAAGRSLPSIADSMHIWAAPLPSDTPVGTHVVYVKATDIFGQEIHGKRIVRVK